MKRDSAARTRPQRGVYLAAPIGAIGKSHHGGGRRRGLSKQVETDDDGDRPTDRPTHTRSPRMRRPHSHAQQQRRPQAAIFKATHHSRLAPRYFRGAKGVSRYMYMQWRYIHTAYTHTGRWVSADSSATTYTIYISYACAGSSALDTNLTGKVQLGIGIHCT